MRYQRAIRWSTAALLVILSPGSATTDERAIETPSRLDAVRSFRQQNAAEILQDFAQLLRIPNVATDPTNLRRNAEYLVAQLTDRSIKAELWELPEAPPVVFGSLEVGSRRTLGIYAHYDGQPVDPTAWRTSPWEPTLYSTTIENGGMPLPFPEQGETVDGEWRLYARSAGDDKAPLAALFAALDALAKSNLTPTSNLVFLFEGEEESGSDHLEEILTGQREDLEVDIWLICDGPVHPSRRPQLVFGVRGYAGVDLTVYGANRYLHSGHYGNWAPNPAQRLANLLASMKDDWGRVLIEGFYDSTLPVGEGELQAMQRIPDCDTPLRRELGLAATEAANAPLAERLLLPTLNIRGLASASVGESARNVIPTEATASLDLRLAKGNDPESMLDLVEQHIRDQGYRIVRQHPDLETRLSSPKIVRVERRPGYPAARTPMDLPIVRDIVAAAEVAAGEAVLSLPTLGGSLPLHLFEQILGAPMVVVPIANHDDNQHAPDENLRIANLWYGIDLMASLLTLPISSVHDDELEQLSRWMTGVYSSGEQAAADPESFLEIRLAMQSIWHQRDDGPWIYVEQAAADSLEFPYRQRVYHLRRLDDGTLLSEVFTLPGDPLSLAGSWRQEHPLAGLSPADLSLREGCSIRLQRAGEDTYAGATRGSDCGSELRGASYATSEVVITEDILISWDRGFDASGRQVWGSEMGPYEFRKIDP